MPDFIIEIFHECETASSWIKEVIGTSGVYTVTYNSFNPGRYENNYACTCPSFKFGNRNKLRGDDATCKHIEQVKTERCGWMEVLDGEKPTEDGKCPRCGLNTHSRQVAV